MILTGPLSSPNMSTVPVRGADPPEPPASVLRSPLPEVIDELWERRTELSPADEQARAAVVGAVDAIDAGQARVAVVDPATDQVLVDERAKRAILLAFRVLPMARSQVGDFRYDDRVPLTTRLDGVRALPGAIVRWGAYVAPGAVLMPSFVNIGAYVDSGTMVDTWATVGSGAQIGKNVHLSGGAGIGGVLEPPNAVPVVVEDEAMVGSRAMVVGGARVRQGCHARRGRHPHPDHPRHRHRDRRRTAPRRGAALVGVRRRDPAADVPRRHVRHAVPAGPQAAARGRPARQIGPERHPA